MRVAPVERQPDDRREALDDFVYAPPTEPWLAILHEDRDLLVVDKPAGLLSTPGRDPAQRDSVLTRAQAHHPRAELVHRLDMDTSGVLLLSTRKKAERALKEQFRQRTTVKEYRARVRGCPAASEGDIELPLICDYPNRPLQKVCFDHGKPSLTRYRVLESDGQTSLLALYPETGRSHQLRVHLQALGHPILGDRFYAPPEVVAASDRLLLHALCLSFDHPYSGERMTLTAPCPFA